MFFRHKQVPLIKLRSNNGRSFDLDFGLGADLDLGWELLNSNTRALKLRWECACAFLCPGDCMFAGGHEGNEWRWIFATPSPVHCAAVFALVRTSFFVREHYYVQRAVKF